MKRVGHGQFVNDWDESAVNQNSFSTRRVSGFRQRSKLTYNFTLDRVAESSRGATGNLPENI